MPKPKVKSNPIQAAIEEWFESAQPRGSHDEEWRESLLTTAPKRYTIYEPMALLPAGSFKSLPWAITLQNLDENSRAALWLLVLSKLSVQAKGTLTHLAVNEGIPLHRDGVVEENVLRSPSGLRMLHGDFGLPEIPADGPSEEDFEKALWVSTKQNGIFQTWAPRWTMFSRGNIKEKARVLSMTASKGSYAVDLYAGIGYFVFSYANLGMKVLCWEINPWSVEGLRRGAKANKWSVRVVQGDDLELPTEEVLAGGDQIVVFLETNEEAQRRIKGLHALGIAQDIQHINCGFLPTSEPTWRSTWDMSALSSEAWLHLHENVGVNDTSARKQEIQKLFEGWATNTERKAEVEHVELVKTFAPGVWHCVFDVHVTQSNVK